MIFHRCKNLIQLSSFRYVWHAIIPHSENIPILNCMTITEVIFPMSVYLMFLKKENVSLALHLPYLLQNGWGGFMWLRAHKNHDSSNVYRRNFINWSCINWCYCMWIKPELGSYIGPYIPLGEKRLWSWSARFKHKGVSMCALGTRIP